MYNIKEVELIVIITTCPCPCFDKSLIENKNAMVMMVNYDRDKMR